MHFPIEEINILSGVGKGVIGIKLDEGDTCLGGALSRAIRTTLWWWRRAAASRWSYGRREMASRGGKGFEAVKRTTFVRMVPPPIELVDWDKVEGKAEEKNGKVGDERGAEVVV